MRNEWSTLHVGGLYAQGPDWPPQDPGRPGVKLAVQAACRTGSAAVHDSCPGRKSSFWAVIFIEKR